MTNIKDAVWGFVVGDALGVPYEFSTRNMMKENPAQNMVGYGTYNQPPGTWSDDTSMMLCVLENLISDGDIKSLANLFVQWYKYDYLTPHGELFDIGITTAEALQKVSLGVKPWLSGGNGAMSSGNGSLMRSLPYAFVEDINKSIFQMTKESKITHRNSICSYCCMFYVKMSRMLLDGKDKFEAVKYAGGYLRHGWRITDEEDDYEEERLLFKRLFNPEFSNTKEEEILSTGYALSTLEAAVWCLLNTNNYKDAVLKAINLGGDTDTIAALTGGLAGICYGYDSIPQEWLDQIASPHLINNLLQKIDLHAKYIQKL
jgi:ADP-ribosyl-[dinitrogen reductase] hydrolase